MKQTILDLQDDFIKLSALAQSARGKVLAYENLMKEHPDWYRKMPRAHMSEAARRLEQSYDSLIKTAEACAKILPGADEAKIGECIAEKAEAFHLLRILQGELGALLAAGDWQSPTYDHTLMPQAGRQTGRIEGSANDYKRDFHFDGPVYEKAFGEQYIESGSHIPPRAAVMSSGMAAFTTVVNHLQFTMKVKGPIMVGRSSYFQNQWILQNAFPDKIVYFDESDTEGIIEKAKKIKPDAVFIDTLCNNESINVADVNNLLPKLSQCLSKSCFLVIDNTAMSIFCQPLIHMPMLLHPRYFVIESLMKYHQFGMDRVTGGVVWCSSLDVMNFMITRMHLGTVMPDASVLAMPDPDRELLSKQLFRFERNALMLAGALEERLKSKPHPMISHIVYPGLPSHPGYSWTKDQKFHGSFFTIVFRQMFKNSLMYERLISKIMDEAKKAGVNLVAGTSFGMDVTRVYLAAKYADKPVKPFLRVSVGTETEMEMKKLIEVFEKAMW